MPHLLDTISVVGQIEIDGASAEVCATTESVYDQHGKTLTVTLDSFVRPLDLAAPEQQLREAWLPKRQVVHAQVPIEEASDQAREVAASWRKRVRDSIPAHIVSP